MNRLNILHLPLWYPNPDDVQLGNFIVKHIAAIGTKTNSCVLAIQAVKSLNNMVTEVKKEQGFTEILVFYPYQKNPFKKLKSYWLAVQKGLKLLKQEKFHPHLIHTHVAGRNLWLANRYFKPVAKVHTEHWSGFITDHFAAKSVLEKRRTLRYLNKFEAITAVSYHLKTAMQKAGITKEIALVENVIATPENIKNEITRSGKFLFVGDLVDQIKGISGIIEAVANLQSEFPAISLTIIGDGEDRVKLEFLTRKLDVTDKIYFLGRLNAEATLRQYTYYDALIVNSKFETYSMVTAEALLTNLPVISSKCGGPEQFITGQNGFLFDRKQKSLERALRQFLTNEMQFEFPLLDGKKLSSRSVSQKFIEIYECTV